MRIDLPLCSFKNCRYNFDGNCESQEKKEKCEFDIYKNFTEEQTGRWISCSKRLPQHGERVLVSCSDRVVRTMVCGGKPNLPEEYIKNGFSTGINKQHEMFYAVAWQPLPEPYEVNKDE